MKPEAKAREVIDTQLQSAGWVLQDYKQLDPHSFFGNAEQAALYQATDRPLRAARVRRRT